MWILLSSWSWAARQLYIQHFRRDMVRAAETEPGCAWKAVFTYLLSSYFEIQNSNNTHSFTVLSVSNKGLGLSQQADAPPSGRTGGSVIRECGYTPYACCGISFLTTTTVNTLHFSKPIRKSSRTIHAGFLKNCGYSYIIYFVLLHLPGRGNTWKVIFPYGKLFIYGAYQSAALISIFRRGIFREHDASGTLVRFRITP